MLRALGSRFPNCVQLTRMRDTFDHGSIVCRGGLAIRSSPRPGTEQAAELVFSDEQNRIKTVAAIATVAGSGGDTDADVRIERTTDAPDQDGGGKDRGGGYDLP